MALFFVVLQGLISIISTLLLVVLSGKMIPYTDASGQVLIDGAGHWVQFEQPEAFDAALLQALG